jgi:hypothetical protein
MVIEPNLDNNHMELLSKMYPPDWMRRIQVARGKSSDILPKLQDNYDLIFIDGDHTKDAVRADWEGLKDKWSCFCLLDDWMMDKGTDAGIQVHEALEECELPSDVRSELIVMDRRIFIDDRQWPDEKIRYGQLLLTREGAAESIVKKNKVSETWDW